MPLEDQYQTGRNYCLGANGFPLDVTEGLKWLQRVAETGHLNAMVSLFYFSEKVDPQLSEKWALEVCCVSLRNGVGHSCSTSQQHENTKKTSFAN